VRLRWRLLPIPGLDGSHLLTAIGERLTGRRIPELGHVGLDVLGYVCVGSLVLSVLVLEVWRLLA
jgi:membrane-associated protease RseP (regulator of RpoE activity)